MNILQNNVVFALQPNIKSTYKFETPLMAKL